MMNRISSLAAKLSGARALLLALACALLVPAAGAVRADAVQTIRYETPGAFPMLQPAPSVAPKVPILVTDDRVSPRRAVVRGGESIVWRSMARQGTRIVFEREVARSMVCHSLVNFEIDGDSLRSAPLRTGDTSSFCQLAPGRYRYRIERTGPAERPTTGAIQLSSRIEGELVVEAGPSVAAR